MIFIPTNLEDNASLKYIVYALNFQDNDENCFKIGNFVLE